MITLSQARYRPANHTGRVRDKAIARVPGAWPPRLRRPTPVAAKLPSLITGPPTPRRKTPLYSHTRYDPDGDNLTVTAVGTPANGTASINADNSVTYTPNSGTTASEDSFSYTIADGQGGTSTATVTVYLANQPPVANDVSVSHGTAAVTVDVLANDWDPDGDALTVTAVGTPTSGTAAINGDGTITYTPNSGTSATADSFSYTIADGQGGTSSATVSVFIADQPPVANDVYAPHATAAVTVDVLANDWDPDGDAMTVTSVGTPANGTATINADNTITYTPNSGFTGSSDLFTYTIADGQGGTSSALVFVGMIDHAPVAVNEAFDHVTATTTLAVLAQDYDADGDTLTVTSIGTPAHGTASLNSDGTVTFTPAGGYSTDSFTYTIADGQGGTSTGTVSIFSNDQAPVAGATNVVGVTAAVTVDVLANASDPDGDALTVTAVGTPGHGTAVNNSDGTVTYTPNSGYSGTDTFTYTIADGYGDTATGTVSLQVGDPGPMASKVAATLTGTTAITVPVLPFCADGDGDSLTVTSVGSATYGSTGINGGAITYTPTSASSSGALIDEFSYTIADGHGGTSSASVTITLMPTGYPGPFANEVDAADPGNTAIRIPVLANDSDPDSDTLTITSVGTPTQGTAVVNGDGTVTYTPSPGATSSDSFTYTISDGHGNDATAAVTVALGGEVIEPIALVSAEVNADFIGIVSASESGTTVTLTTDGASGFTAGNAIVVAGYSGTSAGYNGTWTIGTVSGTTVTFTDTASGLPTLTNDANGYAISLNTTSDLQPGAGYGHQRSMVDSIAYTFNQPVNVAAGAVTLGTVAPTVMAGSATPATGVPGEQWTSLAGGTVWVMTFTTSGSNTVTGHSIADGVYTPITSMGRITSFLRSLTCPGRCALVQVIGVCVLDSFFGRPRGGPCRSAAYRARRGPSGSPKRRSLPKTAQQAAAVRPVAPASRARNESRCRSVISAWCSTPICPTSAIRSTTISSKRTGSTKASPRPTSRSWR